MSDFAKNENKIFIQVNGFNKEIDEQVKEAEKKLVTILTLVDQKEKEYNKVLIEKTKFETKLSILTTKLENLKLKLSNFFNDFMDKQKSLRSEIEIGVTKLNRLIEQDLGLENYLTKIDEFKNRVDLVKFSAQKSKQYEVLTKEIDYFSESIET